MAEGGTGSGGRSVSLRIEAFGKVNRWLLVKGLRPDGYHELDTLFQTIDVTDGLRFEEADRLTLSISGGPIPGGGENLVLRAARALLAGAGIGRGARIHLSKRIPVAAGLGGGSGDAAAALLGLNALWGLGLGSEELCAVASSIGSDVAFFLFGGRARGTGRGEVIETLPDRPDEWMVLLLPPFGLPTPEVYRALAAGPPPSGRGAHLPNGALPDRNDLEAAAERLCPELRSLREALKGEGAVTARLSGSGSAVWGAFPGERAARGAAEALDGMGGARARVTRTVSRGEWARRALPTAEA